MIKNIKIKYFLFTFLFFAFSSFIAISPVSAQVTGSCGDQICETNEFCPTDCDNPNNPTDGPISSNTNNSTSFCSIITDPGALGPRLGNYLSYITCFIGKSVVPLIFGLAAVMFFYGVVQYVIGANDEKERAKGKQFMIWGLVAIAVMISVWGLVRVLTNTFDIDFSAPQVKQ